jgi:hypothetical protein
MLHEMCCAKPQRLVNGGVCSVIFRCLGYAFIVPQFILV